MHFSFYILVIGIQICDKISDSTKDLIPEMMYCLKKNVFFSKLKVARQDIIIKNKCHWSMYNYHQSLIGILFPHNYFRYFLSSPIYHFHQHFYLLKSLISKKKCILNIAKNIFIHIKNSCKPHLQGSAWIFFLNSTWLSLNGRSSY